MIEGLRPYPEIAGTKVDWLPQLPPHWQVMRAKHVFLEVDCRSVDGAETHLSMHQKLGLVPSASTGEKRLVSESYAGGKVVEPNDLVLNRLKAHLGVFAHASQQGVISPDYTVLRPLPNAGVRYYEYLLKSPACRGELRTRIKGIVEGFWRLYTDDFYDIRLPVPPLDEQRLIVRFLDWHGAMTGKLVRAKRRLIALLNEQKQSVIHRAVTRGLDPAAKLKPSGADWLGDVPEHWEVLKLKHLTEFHNGLAFKPTDWASEGAPIIRIQNLNGSSEFNYTTNADLPAHMLIGRGDMMFAWSGNRGTSFGPFIWDRDVAGYLNQHIFKLVGFSSHAKYFYYTLKAVTKHVEDETHGIIGLVHITKPALGSIKVPVAPTEEQILIADYIDEQCAAIDEVISDARREIDLVQEFRTRLIADVVTGQLDVRAVAASLPDVTDAVDDLTDDGELTDDVNDLIDEEEAA